MNPVSFTLVDDKDDTQMPGRYTHTSVHEEVPVLETCLPRRRLPE